MDREQEALRALNRFGLGARAGEAAGLNDPRGWLLDQLDGAAPEVDGPVPRDDEVWSRIRAFQDRRSAGDRDGAREAGRLMRDLYTVEARALMQTRVASRRPFVERLVAFWSNHLCVSITGKALLAPLAGMYERQAIRPHVLGRFEEMVLASARHPAMLLYLDNVRSIGPASPAARRAGRRGSGRRSPGLNENYARELLELHTVGVHGGYDQTDVEELARLLTGWAVPGLLPRGAARLARVSGGDAFAFVAPLHEPGTKTVLGREYGEGLEEGERAIRELCRHPATARFVAGKLARHFLGEEPPMEAAEALAGTFHATGGDLRAVARRLVALEAAWAPATRVFRTPQDWLVSVLRAVHAPEAPENAPGILRQLRHTLWAPQAPKGYPEGAGSWADPDSLMNRAELARSLARRAPRRDLRPERLLDVLDLPDGDPLPALLGDDTIDPAERLALVLGGPAFQWR